MKTAVSLTPTLELDSYIIQNVYIMINQLSQGDADTAVSYKDGNLSHNPGRIDPHNPAFDDSRKPLAAQFKFHGEQVIMLANHWNSKNGDMPLFGSQQPPVLQSENQRVEIAKAVGRFVEQVQKDNPQANIISVGDYNDFQWSKTNQNTRKL
ncbi:endonuclease/exonuclease/phosphatase family protein [Staphylococcus gallinarum]|uniref:Endonuclease/exonuclease/phosphatase family protein n=1 Tax=Staphylococcus gallinarum TaxID=1293 RepID=A0A380FC51_STAGA|nr:endonuclease/exonuclease/phosphatase family protein [Staphylococcus gallinarum]